ncbi:hypothetical protein [Methanococcus maripaludis]|jgi:hypothetical protein|uniref:Uncharacterized protein n=2 Tax=Methanococcus maripaludis TaxID=39152 RepID=Q6LXH3_METMP|nr:hypothetical protein [Methanococcus maripaludis]MBA2850218.1 hypothetical protein [Methanococcus maripaludis]MBA2857651.1 hypothetical protein [Methanococcus maripaludis]MBB6067128.1 hypothetical protein [Methanococcus maripaludis]MBG0768973.1 hypothetical protein [Methanococcus maripaludis]MBM7409418.1 hypothetical protein [Methanococcus maripaludis]
MGVGNSIKNVWREIRGKPSVELQEIIDTFKARGSYKCIEDCMDFLELNEKLKQLSGNK